MCLCTHCRGGSRERGARVTEVFSIHARQTRVVSVTPVRVRVGVCACIMLTTRQVALPLLLPLYAAIHMQTHAHKGSTVHNDFVEFNVGLERETSMDVLCTQLLSKRHLFWKIINMYNLIYISLNNCVTRVRKRNQFFFKIEKLEKIMINFLMHSKISC